METAITMRIGQGMTEIWPILISLIFHFGKGHVIAQTSTSFLGPVVGFIIMLSQFIWCNDPMSLLMSCVLMFVIFVKRLRKDYTGKVTLGLGHWMTLSSLFMRFEDCRTLLLSHEVHGIRMGRASVEMPQTCFTPLTWHILRNW